MKEDNVLSHVGDVVSKGATPDAGLMVQASEGLSKAVLDCVMTTLDEEKAEDIISIPLAGKSEIADHMVIASGRSSRQVSAISELLVDRLKADLGVLSKVEGKEAGDWVLIDAGDVIVHVFRPEVREFYQLEKMWASPGASENTG